MGRYEAKKRQEERKKRREKESTPQRTFTTGRRKPGGKNRTAVKAEPKKLANIPPSKRPKDMQAGKVYGDAGQPKAPKLPPKPTAAKPKPKPVVKAKAKPPTPKKSAVSTYKDKKDTKGLSIGRHKTLKEHRAAVAAAKLTKKGKNVGPVSHGGTYASAMKKKKDKK